MAPPRGPRYTPTPPALEVELLGDLSYCHQCGEWWPADDEFFAPRKGKYRSPCRACEAEQKAEWRERKKQGAVA